jgi:hypothetical protein
MDLPATFIWSFGLGLAWLMPTVIPGIGGVLTGAILGGSLAGLAIAAMFKRQNAQEEAQSLRRRFFISWIIALLVGQVIIRSVANVLGSFGIEEVLWITACAIASFLSGAIGATPASAIEPKFILRWSIGMLIGGLAAAIITAYNIPVMYPLLGGRIEYLLLVQLGFFLGGFVAGLVTVATVRPNRLIKAA